MSDTAIHNLWNRIRASKAADAYHLRMFVDVPTGDLENILDQLAAEQEARRKAEAKYDKMVRDSGSTCYVCDECRCVRTGRQCTTCDIRKLTKERDEAVAALRGMLAVAGLRFMNPKVKAAWAEARRVDPLLDAHK